MNILKIINAKESNFEAIYELICELENTIIDRPSFYNVYSHNLICSDIHYIIAVEDHNVVGFASLHIQHLLHHVSKIGELQEIIVHQEKRGLKIGKNLFDSIKKIAIENKCTQLEICCRQTRKESHEFYLKQGAENSHYKFTIPLN